MRLRRVVAVALLIVPAVASAQRIPLPRIGRRAPRPAELPPQPGVLAREMAYRRLRLSVESYPLLSFVHSPEFTGDGMVSNWATFGMGTRADYRLTSMMSATFDLTSSFLGGPAIINTAEIGTRFRPNWSERRLYPFADLRVGYLSAYNRYLGTFNDGLDGSLGPDPFYSGPRYSSGFGGVGGIGMEYLLTTRFSLTTAGTVMHTHMRTEGIRVSDRASYGMTSVRYTLGLKFNPIRTIVVNRTTNQPQQ
jgi:hypothetical protein